ncbi:MAG: PEP-CTERM sorting domain-containing protein [Akkermansiaceae bacterium]|nr:PEP-CTERM sorting domain-containing protein [Akkermansiaceae bacterium]
MKLKLTSILLLLGATLPASATITLTTAFGNAYTAAGATVPNGTLWALVVDTNNDSSFMGQFGVNTSLSLAGANNLFATGNSIALGTLLGGDTVFAMGGFNADGTSYDQANLTIGLNGVQQGLKFAFVWFPGVTFTTEGATYTVGTQVGALHSNTDAVALGDMVIPADGAVLPTGAGTADGAGGTLPASRFTAVQLIPEPSTMLLGAFGALGLLRRRR